MLEPVAIELGLLISPRPVAAAGEGGAAELGAAGGGASSSSSNARVGSCALSRSNALESLFCAAGGAAGMDSKSSSESGCRGSSTGADAAGAASDAVGLLSATRAMSADKALWVLDVAELSAAARANSVAGAGGSSTSDSDAVAEVVDGADVSGAAPEDDVAAVVDVTGAADDGVARGARAAADVPAVADVGAEVVAVDHRPEFDAVAALEARMLDGAAAEVGAGADITPDAAVAGGGGGLAAGGGDAAGAGRAGGTVGTAVLAAGFPGPVVRVDAGGAAALEDAGRLTVAVDAPALEAALGVVDALALEAPPLDAGAVRAEPGADWPETSDAGADAAAGADPAAAVDAAPEVDIKPAAVDAERVDALAAVEAALPGATFATAAVGASAVGRTDEAEDPTDFC